MRVAVCRSRGCIRALHTAFSTSGTLSKPCNPPSCVQSCVSSSYSSGSLKSKHVVVVKNKLEMTFKLLLMDDWIEIRK